MIFSKFKQYSLASVSDSHIQVSVYQSITGAKYSSYGKKRTWSSYWRQCNEYIALRQAQKCFGFWLKKKVKCRLQTDERLHLNNCD